MSVNVRVADNKAEGLDEDGGRWSVICVTHGTLLSADSRTEARDGASDARRLGFCEWCEECMDAIVPS
jgi:hypothetical protein